MPLRSEGGGVTNLALDLGTKTGFKIGTRDAFTSGTMSFAVNSRFEGGGMRFLRFRRWLNEIAAAHGPITRIGFEEVRNHKGVDAAHVYGGLMGHLTAWCEENEVPYEAIPVGAIKKHWTGKGNANKEAMIAASVERGLSPVDDNEADAQALFDLMLQEDGQ